VWLGLLRLLYVTLCVFALADVAQAQTQSVNNQQNPTLAPPTDGLQNQQPNAPVYGQALAPAPTIAPLMSREDQARHDAKIIAAQQQNTQAAQQNNNAMNGMPQEGAKGIAVPVGTTPQATQQNNQMLVPQNGGAPVPMQQAVAPAQGVPAATPTTPQGVPAATPTQAPAETPAAKAEATAQPAPSVTTTTGFAPATSGKSLPLTSGTMPTIANTPVTTTNPGMDMSINSNLVGGAYDPNLPPSPTNPVPYEVQLEQRTQEIQQKARAQAFEQAKRSSLPLETYEIRDMLGRLKDTQEAIQTPVRPAPTPGNVIQTISTDPSATPQTIQLAAGNVTTLNVVDITGAPWPIVDIGFGGPFDVKPPEPGGHVIRITPLKDFARGNLVIRLLKLTTPLTFSLQAGGDKVDYRFDARIPDYGPNAKMPLINNGIQSVAGDKVTTAFLEGVPPSGAEKMKVDGIDARTTAYKFSGSLYVRTPLSLLSPAWTGSATSADGMNVYVLNDAPVLLLSDKGTLVRAKLTDDKKTTMGF